MTRPDDLAAQPPRGCVDNERSPGVNTTAPPDLAALHGQQVTVEQVDVVEDTNGIPSWIYVEREVATVVIAPRLLGRT